MASRIYRTSLALAALLGTANVFAAFDLIGGWPSDSVARNDDDLTSFVTRPEIKAPRYNVSYKAESGITPGYWFLAPYADIVQHPHPDGYYHPCSTGPHIYDGNGDLVWSGACQSQDQNACDFRLHINEDGAERLSTLYMGYKPEYYSTGVIMDSSFETLHSYSNKPEEPRLNMHEFNVIDNGRSALYILGRGVTRDISALNISKLPVGRVAEPGIREIEIPSGRVLFEWWAGDSITFHESTIPPNIQELKGQSSFGWNWFHSNSIDKNDAGEYIVSGRFTDTIYKIGPAGDIVWRLGGNMSSFELEDFNFSKQHDARFVSRVGEIETISLFDNAKALHPGVDVPETTNTSSAIVIEINHSTKRAKVIRRIWRPDNLLTRLRGNYQRLDNGHDFVSWAGNGYLSEHDPDGKLLLSARFASKRLVTYRAYKHNFTSYPNEPPVLKATVYGETPDTSTTVWFTSWNGATEVVEWRYYSATNSTIEGNHLVGVQARTGFETTFMSEGYESMVYAEAVSSNGTVLGSTELQQISLPSHWRAVGNHNEPLGDDAFHRISQLTVGRPKDEL